MLIAGALLAVVLGAATLLAEVRRLHRADRRHARVHERRLRRLVRDRDSLRMTCLPPPVPATATTAR